ncbi:hypothetical protein ARAM_003150 [Aspergillus rambellii]|uniref:RED-like N-terminal domain-containing protein n=1 Tax=Aspergillus rambellii TaxID=308745 RepID=A0A0F8V2C3_9EURO|nr:hypothetical protein ARAM_003150 [Aspergillus rambellii]
MNNNQFRRLLFDTSSSTRSTPKSGNADQKSPEEQQQQQQHAGSTTGGPSRALGSRMRSSIPMTPRSVTTPDFARQLAEYRRESSSSSSSQPPTKKFKSSAAPKGTRLPAGYQDRAARLRGDAAAANEEAEAESETSTVEKRLEELEEKVKMGVVDEDTFTGLRRQLGVGGDVGSTHMVKGLDWDLLRRVRAGEDISTAEERADDVGEMEGVDDVDGEFDRVLGEKGSEVLPSAPREREKKKKGSMAPPPGVPAQRKTRDEILRELKASRAAAAGGDASVGAAPSSEPALGDRFKRIGGSKVEKKRLVEQDETGRRREVLLITDAEGKTKRKVRWLDKPGVSGAPGGLLVPDKDAKPLGMEVPAEIASRAKPEENDDDDDDDDDDIFAGVGADYDPLGDIGSDEGSSDSDSDGEKSSQAKKAPVMESEAKATPVGEAQPRNYFATTTTEEVVETNRSNPLTKDPVLLAALKRAAALRQGSPSEEGAGEAEDVDRDTLLRRKKFLEEARRREALDAMDMDYGFGGSRNEDDEDDETVLLEDERGGKKRKRGPKKKKGDKDSASDVLQVLEGRKTS